MHLGCWWRREVAAVFSLCSGGELTEVAGGLDAGVGKRGLTNNFKDNHYLPLSATQVGFFFPLRASNISLVGHWVKWLSSNWGPYGVGQKLVPLHTRSTLSPGSCSP